MSTINGLRILAHVALGSAKKRRQISGIFKKSGLIALGKGAWLGHRSKDVVSGFVIEGSALDTYISGFILPAFDRHKFVNLSLGDRIVNCEIDGNTQSECKTSIDYYIENLSHIQSSNDLIEDICGRNVKGHYPIWVRYISYLRRFDFEAAINYMDDDKRAQLHPSLLNQLDEISPFVSAHDKDSVFRVFEEWSAFSGRIFGPLDHTFDAF